MAIDSLKASVSIVERFGSPEQKAVLANVGIRLSPTAMAEVQTFTASASCPDRLKQPMVKAKDHTALWGPVAARRNVSNGFK